MTQVTPNDVLEFWLKDVSTEQWYNGSDELDQQIIDRFQGAWELAHAGGLKEWLTKPETALAYLILTDQFPRNMFRGDPRSFATDRRALAVAKQAITRNWDMDIEPPARQFFYLPLMHSESLSDQERCIRLFKVRMGQGGDNLIHAKVHREIIRIFGRFPYRNEALGRMMTASEKVFLGKNGYGELMAALS